MIWRVLAETDAADTTQREYVYGNYLDEVLVMVDTDAHYYAQDHLFSPANNIIGQARPSTSKTALIVFRKRVK